MRKTIVTALIALLVMLAVVSCDIGSVAEKAEYTEDGVPLVKLKVSVGGSAGSRALTNALAKDAAANYMEVIFTYGGKYYRAEGKMLQPLEIKIPMTEYDKTNAILLIGRKKDSLLLATGTTSTKVDASTDEVKFTILALTADLFAGGTPTFDIKEDSGDDGTGTGGPPPPLVPIEDTRDGIFKNQTKLGTLSDDEATPCFQVPTGMAGIEATLSIGGLTDSGANIIVTGTPAVTFTGTEKTGAVTGGVAADPAGIAVTTTNITPAPDTALTTYETNGTIKSDGVIGFKFTTTTEGEYTIKFDIPVVGFSTSANPIPGVFIWHIRGGTKGGYQGDTDTSAEAAREGVALRVTDVPIAMQSVTIGPIQGSDW